MLNGIAGEERDVEAGVEEGLAEVAHVLRVLGEEAVFVLDLHHKDRAAVRDLERAEDAADFSEVALGGLHVLRIARAEFDGIFLEQPPREAAHFPFRAGVGAGAKNHPQSFFLGDFAELGDVGLAGPIEFAGLRFMHVPEEIGADGVEAHGFGGLESIAPVFARDARGMNFAAADLEALAVEKEIFVADAESVRG